MRYIGTKYSVQSTPYKSTPYQVLRTKAIRSGEQLASTGENELFHFPAIRLSDSQIFRGIADQWKMTGKTAANTACKNTQL